VYGDRLHRGNLITSIYIIEADLEVHNRHLLAKYEHMIENEQLADSFRCDDADWLIVACNTPARMAKGAVQELREHGVKAGLFRPISLWPFPIKQLTPLLDGVHGMIVVEAGPGQLEDEVRLALSHADIRNAPPIDHVRRYGGVLPQQQEIVDKITALVEA
jgi:pyruvate/2-oxoacid:ferredoxin oxidoreductase alpha subunit